MTYIHLTRNCDRNCAFCRTAAQDGVAVALRAQRAAAAVRQAVSTGARQLIFSGAEPTVEPYLLELLALARRLGVQDLRMESHAGTIDGRRAAQLAAAGLRHAIVAVNTLHVATADAITGSPGDLKRTASGIRALLAAGIDVDLAVALLAPNVNQLAELRMRAGQLAQGGAGQLRRIVVRAIATSPKPCALAELPELVSALQRAAQVEASLPLVQADGEQLPPCLFAAPERVAGLFRLSVQRVAREADRYARLPACAQCPLADRCPGAPPAWAERAAPLADPKACLLLAMQAAPVDSVQAADDGAQLAWPEVESRWPQLMAGLGLVDAPPPSAPARSGLAARLPPAHPQWPISAADCDREALELRGGLRELLRREVPDVDQVSSVVAALQRAGLQVAVTQSVVPGVAGRPRTHVFAALDPTILRAAERLDPILHDASRAKQDAISQFGAWFGYPPCCVAAFVQADDCDDATLVAQRARLQEKRVLQWPQNWAVVPARLGSFLPCTPDCPQALSHALRVVALVHDAAPAWLAAARPLLQSAVLTLGFDRAAVLVGAGADAGG